MKVLGSIVVLFSVLAGILAADPKCLQVDITFALSISNTTDPAYYNSTVKPFIKYLTDAFSAVDEVSSGSRQFARFSLLESGGWISMHTAIFANRTRAQIQSDIIDPIYYDVVSEHDGPMIEEQMSRSVWMLQGDWAHFGYTTVTTNRILIIVTDRVNYEDFYNKEMYLYQVQGYYPVIFGVGMPGIDGNLVASNINDMIEVTNGIAERAFKTIADAKDPSTGILAQIGNLFECPTVACSGFGFLYEDADMSGLNGKIFLDATAQIVRDLNSTHNGFDVQDSFGIHYSPIIYDANTAIRYINYYNTFTGFFGDFQNYTRATIFDLMLQVISSGWYNNYGFFILSQTDTDWNYTYSLEMAHKVAATNVPVYVLDGSSSYYNTQELFKIVTHNKPERIINMTNVLDTDHLVSYLRQYMVPEFQNLGCNPNPTLSPSSCGGIVFISEMTQALSTSEKSGFFTLVNDLVTQVSNTLKFAFAEFGNGIYVPIELQNQQNFLNKLHTLQQNYTATNLPNANAPYLAPILNSLAIALNENFDDKLTVLIMAEAEAIRDPTAAFTAAQSIAAINANVYVLDYSIGTVSGTLFKTLTSDKPNHVVNGTGLSPQDLLQTLTATLVADVNAGKC